MLFTISNVVTEAGLLVLFACNCNHTHVVIQLSNHRILNSAACDHLHNIIIIYSVIV